MIVEAGDNAFFIGSTNDCYIKQIEDVLSVKLPQGYKWFLSKYGYGFFYSVFILGIGKDKSLVCAEETLKKRKLGLPSNFIVVEDCDEWVYCINCDDGKVCMWSSWDPNFDYCYNDFYDYLFSRFSEVQEDRG